MEHTPESQPQNAQPNAGQEVAQVKPASKSLFIDEEAVKKIYLDDDSWVTVPKHYGAGFVEDMSVRSKDDKAKISEFLFKVIREWNLVDADGNIAPISIAYIRKLSAGHMMKIVKEVNQDVEEQIEVPKAEPLPSTEPSSTEVTT